MLKRHAIFRNDSPEHGSGQCIDFPLFRIPDINDLPVGDFQIGGFPSGLYFSQGADADPFCRSCRQVILFFQTVGAQGNQLFFPASQKLADMVPDEIQGRQKTK